MQSAPESPLPPQEEWRPPWIEFDLESMRGLGHLLFLIVAVFVGGYIWIARFLFSDGRLLPSPYGFWLVPALILAALLELVSLVNVGIAINEGPLDWALRRRRIPWVLRPVFCAWWIGQMAVVIATAHEIMPAQGLVGPTKEGQIFVYTLQVFVLYMGTYGSNCYLLLAVAALWPLEGLLKWVWRMRALLDLLLTAAVMGGWHWLSADEAWRAFDIIRTWTR